MKDSAAAQRSYRVPPAIPRLNVPQAAANVTQARLAAQDLVLVYVYAMRRAFLIPSRVHVAAHCPIPVFTWKIIRMLTSAA